VFHNEESRDYTGYVLLLGYLMWAAAMDFTCGLQEGR
jgi:hypothetical protein